MRDHVEIARRYAEDVLAGRIAACLYVRQACQRHIDGLSAESADSYPYRLDAAKARVVCRFIELLPHIKGKWARNRELFVLSPWQCFIVVNVFGWVRKSDGLRRYRRVYVEVPRKNGKSSFTAAIGLYMLTEEGEHGAEVYSGATSEKQAWEVFGPARLMAKGSAAFAEHYGVTIGAKNLHVLRDASKFEPIIGKPGDGASPSFSITDEYHEHNTADQYDTMVTGMAAREQPIAWVITTAGYDTSGPCYALRGQAVDVLSGNVSADELFSVIYTLDPDDDWTTAEARSKANPNLGVSVFEDFLVAEQRRAVANPREQATYKTKHCNIWVTGAQPYFNGELWDRQADSSLDPAQFAGEPCRIGLDLASKLDIAAAVRVFRRIIDGQDHFYVFGRFYIPRARVEEPERRHYLGWVEDGWMTATPGDITDYDYIEADIKADAELHSVQQVAADPYNATQLLTHLQGFLGADKVIEVPQTVMHLSEPMKELQALIVSGRIHHDGNPALSWMIGNVTAQEDRNQNVFPRKERAELKIDGAVATILGLNGWLREEPAPVYDIYILGAGV